jgi:2'-5' RNA ligase
MRLFISIQFNDEIKEALSGIQKKMQGKGIRGNYTDTANLHLTLAFIGEYQDPEDILDIIDEIDFEPFELTLDHTGMFDHGIVWCGIKDDGSLTRIAAQLRHRLAEKGIPFDRKKFSAHITLVRKAEWNGYFPEIEVPETTMEVQRISLMRSDRTKHGMVYTEIGEDEE